MPSPQRLVVLDPPAETRPTTRRDDDDHFHDECGVFGVVGHPEAANITYLGLHALQHRGQESAGIADARARVKGAYSLLFLTEDTVIAVRDPMGIRPLCLGLLPSKKDAHVIASEPCAFDLIGAEYVRDVEPGEMVVIDASGIRSVKSAVRAPQRSCVFEYVYFARPDSRLGGKSVYDVRKSFGATLAKEHPIQADVVIPVPDSGVPAAIGYASALNIPFEMGLIRSHYVGRTFIEPQDSIRHFGVRLKLNPVEPVLRGKRVVVIDDSIVRGTTSRKIVKMVRDAGAREVHLRISSPPTQGPSY
jgi:amidophosphoribosyltransferase